MKYVNEHKTTNYGSKTYSMDGSFVRFDNRTLTLLINKTTYDKNLDNTDVWIELDKVIDS